MRILLAAVGRLKAGPERDLFARYTDRLGKAGRSVSLGPLTVTELAEARHAEPTSRKNDEAGRLLAAADACDHRVVLDEAGRAFTSQAFADHLLSLRDNGVSDLALLIGGPDGHGEAARAAADTTLSLGPMTLPHGLARIVVAEQLYRAVTIISGHPYHRA
jgi:23S rRNA (pseudouridine1915-N3)-methyltransferase